jgi:hypothetical protein
MRGSGSDPIQTTGRGSMETNNYSEGDAFDFDGSAYPYTVNPAFVIRELNITASDNVVARISTTSGTTFDFPLASRVGAWDHWDIDSVEFRDPDGTAARIAGGVAGE